jgi:hypothetical protein
MQHHISHLNLLVVVHAQSVRVHTVGDCRRAGRRHEHLAVPVEDPPKSHREIFSIASASDSTVIRMVT